MERQLAYFDRPEPARVTAILGAGTLAREVGGPEVMAEQRDHLAAIGRRVKVSIRVPPSPPLSFGPTSWAAFTTALRTDTLTP